MLQRLRKIVVIALAASVVVQPVVYADRFVEPEPISNLQKSHLDIPFTGSGSVEETCSASADDTALVGKDNLEKIYNHFIGRGLSPEQSAGIIGNISVESGGDPTIIQGGAHTKDPSGISAGWGIIQWTPGSKIIGLLKTAEIKTPVYLLKTQLEMVWWHMNNTSPTGVKNMYEKYQTITDVAEATRVYEDEMEGAGIPHIETRIERANEALRKYGGGSGESSAGTTGGVSGDASDCSDSGGATASADGFTFPLVTTQAAIKAGSFKGPDKGVWCYEAQKNCHHDYNAADIHVKEGVVVVAARDGTVRNTNAGDQKANNVTLKLDNNGPDAGRINFYQHLGRNTVKVRIGQHVTGGDELGKVGNVEDAFDTAPHLHFDMLPKSYESRVSCKRSGCSSYPFVEVQPVLTATYKLLPEN
ncbi:MAG TPA: phage tail tip lysozyme [Candidatus Saccharimonadales bacterium]|jgi:hypothetical protein